MDKISLSAELIDRIAQAVAAAHRRAGKRRGHRHQCPAAIAAGNSRGARQRPWVDRPCRLPRVRRGDSRTAFRPSRNLTKFRCDAPIAHEESRDGHWPRAMRSMNNNDVYAILQARTDVPRW